MLEIKVMKILAYIILAIALALGAVYMAVEYTFGSPTDDPDFIAKDIIREMEQPQSQNEGKY